MKHLLDAWARWFHLNHAQYMHLRLLSAVSVVPLLAVLYLVVRFLLKRKSSRE